MQPDEKTPVAPSAANTTPVAAAPPVQPAPEEPTAQSTAPSPTVTPAPAEATQPPAEAAAPATAESVQSGPSGESAAPTAGGYPIAELADAPVKPPTPAKTEDVKMTSNLKVVVIVVAAVLLSLIGVFVAVFGYPLIGIALIVIGAIATLLAVFLPIK